MRTLYFHVILAALTRKILVDAIVTPPRVSTALSNVEVKAEDKQISWAGVYTDKRSGATLTVTQSGSSVTAVSSRPELGWATASGTVVGSQIRMFGLSGTLSNDVIQWTNGATWTLAPWAGVYTDKWSGATLTVTQSGSSVTAVSSRPELGWATASGSVYGSQIRMFGLSGTLSNGVIQWTNGATWTLAWGGVYTDKGTGATITITLNGSSVTAVSNMPQAGWSTASGSVAGSQISMFGITGRLSNGAIQWTNGATWVGKGSPAGR